MNVSTVLDKLLNLQNLEISILREKNRLEQLNEKRKKLIASREELKQKLFELEAEIAGIRASIEDLKNFILYKQERLEKLKEQKNHAYNRKSFKEILRQIAKAEDEIIRAKAELTGLQVKLDELEEKSKEERELLRDAIVRVERELSLVKEEIMRQKESINELEKKAFSVREMLPEDVRKEYESLKEKYNGLVLSDISSGSCEGCGMTYSSAEFASILRNLEPGKTRCPYCGRFVITRRELA
ncbi:zinc ribbon domain-containing protein [Desulfurobacterium sp.]